MFQSRRNPMKGNVIPTQPDALAGRIFWFIAKFREKRP